MSMHSGDIKVKNIQTHTLHISTPRQDDGYLPPLTNDQWRQKWTWSPWALKLSWQHSYISILVFGLWSEFII